MTFEYYTDPKFKKMEIIKMTFFFPLFGLIAYFLYINGFNILLYMAMLIPIGLIGLLQVIKNSKNRPSVLITNNGITINNPLELGEIRWNEIEGVRLEEKFNKQLVCIDLKNPSEHKNKLNKIIRTQAISSEKQLKTHVVIMNKYVSNKTKEIKEKIEEHIDNF